MAIERMKKLTIFFPAGEGERFEEWLYGKTVLHLISLDREFGRIASSGSRVCLDEQVALENLARARELLADAAALHAIGKNFLDSLFPVKTVVSRAELDGALGSMNLAALHAAAKKKSATIRGAVARIDLLRKERASLERFAFLSTPLSRLRALERTFLVVAEGGPAMLSNLSADTDAAALMAWEVGIREPDLVTVAFAGRKGDFQKCADILRAHGFRILDYPAIKGTVSGELDAMRREEERLREDIRLAEAELRRLLPPGTVRCLECARGYWESEKKRAERARSMLCSRKVGIASGYARAADVPALVAEMAEKFPGASVVAENPSPGDEVPVAIRLPRWMKPGQLLINMFGLPGYFAMDPTPFLIFLFLAFFGICFADVFYGALLCAISGLLMRRYRAQENLKTFFKLFLYCGVSTILFGAITGSWAADIYKPEYLGEGNILQRIAHRLTLLDMLEKPVIALMAALAIGIATQFYGIVMKTLVEWKQRNWGAGFCDGILWLVYLGGLILTALALLGNWGSGALKACIGILLAGAVGLVLTQGRNEKSIVAKLLTGIVSLYGVMGTYGTTSFVGDVISYSRLLALGLTTFVVGMSFNIIAKLVSSVPFVGAILFVCLALAGHLINFAVSVLSAFVHSARLILLEFFGRFYQGGGEWFNPHGFSSETLEVTR